MALRASAFEPIGVVVLQSAAIAFVVGCNDQLPRPGMSLEEAPILNQNQWPV
jgi:hypothetical protein